MANAKSFVSCRADLISTYLRIQAIIKSYAKAGTGCALHPDDLRYNSHTVPDVLWRGWLTKVRISACRFIHSNQPIEIIIVQNTKINKSCGKNCKSEDPNPQKCLNMVFNPAGIEQSKWGIILKRKYPKWTSQPSRTECPNEIEHFEEMWMSESTLIITVCWCPSLIPEKDISQIHSISLIWWDISMPYATFPHFLKLPVQWFHTTHLCLDTQE